MACALLLAQRGMACTLLDARPLAALQRDRRLLALSRGSLLVLETLLGRDFAPTAAIRRVLVSSSGSLGSAHLGAADFDGLAVGATCWYAELVGALGDAVARTPGIRVLRPRRALGVDQQANQVCVRLDNGSVLEGSLAIDAEGTPPRLPQPRYSALLAELQVQHCPVGDAIERFTPEGPLALLPVPGAGTGVDYQGTGATGTGTITGGIDTGTHNGTRTMSLVWCLSTDLARERQALPAPELLQRIQAALGPRQAWVKGLDHCSVFGLSTHRLREVCEHRLVHLGNAAQSLHPVAGQGFNLGLRDCLVLADTLAETFGEAQRTGSLPSGTAVPASGAPAGLRVPADPAQALRRYAARRRVDRTLLPALTSALPVIFTSPLLPVRTGRGLGLLALDLLPAVRRPFTRLLMQGPPR